MLSVTSKKNISALPIMAELCKAGGRPDLTDRRSVREGTGTYGELSIVL